MGNRSLFHCSCGGSDNSLNVVVADREIGLVISGKGEGVEVNFDMWR